MKKFSLFLFVIFMATQSLNGSIVNNRNGNRIPVNCNANGEEIYIIDGKVDFSSLDKQRNIYRDLFSYLVAVSKEKTSLPGVMGQDDLFLAERHRNEKRLALIALRQEKKECRKNSGKNNDPKIKGQDVRKTRSGKDMRHEQRPHNYVR